MYTIFYLEEGIPHGMLETQIRPQKLTGAVRTYTVDRLALS